MRQIKLFADKSVLESKLPEDSIRLLRIGDLRICLINRKGEVFALSDECTHDRASMSQGHLNNSDEIVCPLHNYQFNLYTGTCSRENCRPLESYTISIVDGVYYISVP